MTRRREKALGTFREGAVATDPPGGATGIFWKNEEHIDGVNHGPTRWVLGEKTPGPMVFDRYVSRGTAQQLAEKLGIEFIEF